MTGRLVLALVMMVGVAGAQEAPMPSYVKSEVMIPARDGVMLHTVVLRPEGSEKAGAKLPFILQRTPYGIDHYEGKFITGGKPELARSGYIFVYQDIRGRYGSGGQFVMNRPVVAHKGKTDVDETTDTNDTVTWLVKHVANNNGRVGVFGVSYPGFLAMMAGIDANPAVKCVSPQAPMTDVWMGDDFFHNGAFRETYGFDYVQQLEAQKTDVAQSSKEDQFDFFLKHVNFAGAAESAGMTNLPTAHKFLTEPTYTKFWQDMAVQKRLGRPEVPVLEVGGYFDQEDMWGTQAEYAALRPHEDPKDVGNVKSTHRVMMVLGPWNHGQWARGPADALGGGFGKVTFGSATGQYYRETFEAPFFELYLKDRPGFDLKDTASFRTGENAWHRYDIWPPVEGYVPTKMYLVAADVAGNADSSAALRDGNKEVGNGNAGGLTLVAPSSVREDSPKAVAAAYVADPADPVPYRHRPVQSTYGEGSQWRPWLVEDQSFVTGRKDVAVFETPVLDKDVTVTGDVVADLFAKTTGTDTDWVVKLIDVYPDNTYELMVADEIFRGRYRHSFETPEPVKPGEVNEYKWSLHGVDHTFLPGHRIMVEVQSSWFPLYDRNPQTFVPNIMTAPAEAYQKETISIMGSGMFASHIEVPVKQ